jgi:hypothetical protein
MTYTRWTLRGGAPTHVFNIEPGQWKPPATLRALRNLHRHRDLRNHR